MSEILQLGEFRILFDREATSNMYSKIETGFPEKCGCAECLQFIQMREKFYSPELKELLSKLGVDYKKEADVTKFSDAADQWEGFYNFVGEVKGGEEEILDIAGNQFVDFNPAALAVPKEFKLLKLASVHWYWPKSRFGLP